MKELKMFSEVRRYLGRIKYIHCGGCGVSALAMYRWLKKNKKLKSTHIVYLYQSKSLFNKNADCIKNNKGELVAPAHVCLLHDGQFIDAKGIVNLNDWGEYIQIIDVERLVVKNIQNDCWNTLFDRYYYIPKIEERLKIKLS
jgi:hypothetical protein